MIWFKTLYEILHHLLFGTLETLRDEVDGLVLCNGILLLSC